MFKFYQQSHLLRLGASETTTGIILAVLKAEGGRDEKMFQLQITGRDYALMQITLIWQSHLGHSNLCCEILSAFLFQTPNLLRLLAYSRQSIIQLFGALNRWKNMFPVWVGLSHTNCSTDSYKRKGI